MSRTKSFSSTLASITDLASRIINLSMAAQSEYDKLAADSSRLKEIEPALARLQSALSPVSPVASTSPGPDQPPAPEQPTITTPNKPKRRHAKKGEPDNAEYNGQTTTTE